MIAASIDYRRGVPGSASVQTFTVRCTASRVLRAASGTAGTGAHLRLHRTPLMKCGFVGAPAMLLQPGVGRTVIDDVAGTAGYLVDIGEHGPRRAHPLRHMPAFMRHASQSLCEYCC